MKNYVLICLLLISLILGCKQKPFQNSMDDKSHINDNRENEIKALIEKLVFTEGLAKNQPVYSPGITNQTQEYTDRFNSCRVAFNDIMKYKEFSIPYLIEHLDDKRQSINFRNHYEGNSVGDACYWNIHYQLFDLPPNYSSYRYSRKGRDGKAHPQPYTNESPFEEAGGIKKWLNQNKKLTYLEKQIKCLQWLLEKEKIIGASDADSYFLNILPLEIRILELKLENGEDVAEKLENYKFVQNTKEIKSIPPDLLPKR